MYYRKYFAGAIESPNVYRTIQDIAGSTINDYYKYSDVICSAIKSTLEDVGIQCDYDETTRIFNIEGTTIQIVVYNGNGYIRFNTNGLYMGSISAGPFSGLNYKFYITLKGDKDGMFQVFIGTYSTPAAETGGFAIGKGIDLRDGKDIRVAATGTIASASFIGGVILKDDAILPEYKNSVTFGQKLTGINELSNSGKEITLIECVAQPGRFKLNNCYFGSAYLTAGEFYNIGGDVYYSIGQNILVRCVNEQSS